jgi:tRNA G18 (ribose-2'-O)-methylase SpoU
MERRISMLFDCLRAPYDVAHIIQVASALGNCDLYLSGNCIDTNHRKIITKVRSWGIKNIPKFEKLGEFEEAVYRLHDLGKYLIGTAVDARENLYKTNLLERDSVIVFGTEASGLTGRKQSLLDKIVSIPMENNCKFLTLPVIVPITAFEYYRQLLEEESGNS